jgi:hypothetical protein
VEPDDGRSIVTFQRSAEASPPEIKLDISCNAIELGLAIKKAVAKNTGAASRAAIPRPAFKRNLRNTHTPEQKLKTLLTILENEALTLMSG